MTIIQVPAQLKTTIGELPRGKYKVACQAIKTLLAENHIQYKYVIPIYGGRMYADCERNYVQIPNINEYNNAFNFMYALHEIGHILTYNKTEYVRTELEYKADLFAIMTANSLGIDTSFYEPSAKRYLLAYVRSDHGCETYDALSDTMMAALKWLDITEDMWNAEDLTFSDEDALADIMYRVTLRI